MPMIDIGGNEYPSFTSEDAAGEYLAGDITRALVWDAASEAIQKRALVSATRMMVALPWCADPAPDPEDDQESPIPEVAAMLAADLIAAPDLFADASGASNVKSVKAGSAQVEFFSPVDGGPPLPRSLWGRLVAADLVCLGASSGGLYAGAIPFGTSDCERPLGGRWPWDWPIAEADHL